MNIILFPTIGLPIPPTKGGAIEKLIEILIRKNEIEKKAHFYVVTIFDVEAFELQKKYNHTTFINIKKRKIDNVLFFIYKAIRKISKYKFSPMILNSVNYRAFMKLCDIPDIDFCICEGGYYRDFYKISKHFGRDKMILHLHSEFVPNEYIEKTFKYYIGISKFISETWESRLKDSDNKVFTLMNCIDVDKFISSKNSLDIRSQYKLSDKYVVIYVGRIVPMKGVLQLVNAFVSAGIPNSALLIVGAFNFGTDDTCNYEKRIKELSSENENIICTGFVDYSILSAYINASDLMVIPSLCNEGAGLVAIEGLALNKQLIVTNSGGLPEYTNFAGIKHINKDYFDFDWRNSDITNKMVEGANWSTFEENLKEQIISCYQKRNELKIVSIDYAKKFDVTKYYLDFMNIIWEIEADK